MVLDWEKPLLTQEALLEEWRRFISHEGALHPQVKPITLQAWNRCQHLGVDPKAPRVVYLPVKELEQKRRENADLIRAALPYMEHLSRLLEDRPHVVSLSDAEGWILEVKGNPDSLGGREAGLYPGSSWSEEFLGNNGIGTGLSLGQPVVIYGVEHYNQAYHPCTCLGIPIRSRGDIIGCLDVSVRDQDAHPMRMTLALACVSSIESTLQTFRMFGDIGEKLNFFEQSAAMGNFLAAMVHDLKNPLTAIRALSQLGTQTANNEVDRGTYAKIIRQIDDLNEMINKVLTGFRPEKPVVYPPAALLEETVSQFTPLCRQQGVDLEFSCSGQGVGAMHPHLFKRALANLITNAIQSMPSGGRLTVKGTTRANLFLIEIRDSGCGIPPEIQPSIFKPFVCGRRNGTGLGLFMTHKTITEDHRGRIWFDTGPQGTVFYIELPLLTNGQDEAAAALENENLVLA